MADLEDIFQGLAASLVTLRTDGVIGQVSSVLLENPMPPAVMVAGVDEYEYADFLGGVQWTILIEACLGLVSQPQSHRTLRQLLAPTGTTSLVAAVEADQTLTSRYNDENGQVTTDQEEAADSVAFSEYRGQSRFTLENGSTVLLAVWAFKVLT